MKAGEGGGLGQGLRLLNNPHSLKNLIAHIFNFKAYLLRD